jgi:hypothetical protein
MKRPFWQSLHMVSQSCTKVLYLPGGQTLHEPLEELLQPERKLPPTQESQSVHSVLPV